MPAIPPSRHRLLAGGALIIFFSSLLVPVATFVSVLVWAKGWGLGRRFCGGLLTMPPAFLGFGFVATSVSNWLGPRCDLVAVILGLAAGLFMGAVPVVILSPSDGSLEEPSIR